MNVAFVFKYTDKTIKMLKLSLIGIVITFLLCNRSELQYESPKNSLDFLCIQILEDTCIGKTINGERQGFWRCWYNGTYSEMTFIDDKIHGIEKIYNKGEKGKVYLLTSYENGHRQGNTISYYQNGIPHYITTYEYNRQIYTIELDTTGLVKMKGGYIVDSVQVDVTTYDPQTLEVSQIEKEKMLQSIKDGEWSFYEEGRLLKQYIYLKGVVIDSVIIAN